MDAKFCQSTSPTLTHTPDHVNCPACAALEGMQLLGPEVPFADAGRIWLEDHSTYIKRGTYRVYVQYVRTLTEFFGSLPLGEFHVGNVRAYQRWRLGHAGPLRANAEVQSALKPILREANQWKRIADVYKPLPVPKKKVRQNMSEEEERRLVAVALDSTHTRRLLAGHCLILSWRTRGWDSESCAT